MISIQINGLKETRKFMNSLPKNIRDEIGNRGLMDLARNLQGRARRRAPKGATGWLRKSIMVEKDGKVVKVMVHAFYGQAIQTGRKSKMVIPIGFIKQHYLRPDAPAQYVSNPQGWVDLSKTAVSKPRPFMEQALNSLRPKIPSLLNKYVQRAIKKSGGKK